MSKKQNYGKCVLCGLTGNRNSEGLCYYAKCKAKRTQVVKDALAAIPDRNDAPETCGLGADLVADGQDETAVATEESAAEGVAAGQGQDHISQPGKMVEAEANHVGDAAEMVADLDDHAEPFTLAGIQFAPVMKQRPLGENRVTIRKLSIGISFQADKLFDLSQFTHARYTVSLDGKALAIKFLTGPKGDAVKIGRSTGGINISSVPLGRAHPHLIGQRGPLEQAEVGGWFVVRFGEVAA